MQPAPPFKLSILTAVCCNDSLAIIYCNFLITMAVTVLIPTPLQKLTNDQATLELQAGDIKALVDAMEQTCPGIKNRLCSETGELRRFLNFYVNSEDIRFLEGMATTLADGDEVSIVPAVAGG